MKSKTTAAVLAICLGGIGVHRFYLNQTGLGFLYLLFCWTFVPLVISLIDFIIFLSMSDRDFDAKYNAGYASHSSYTHSTTDEIRRLYEMKEKGIITQEEFELKKRMLL